MSCIFNNNVVTHEMSLQKAPFDSIKSGLKTVEMRLNDEKRRGISKGDLILFRCVDNGEEILVRVEDKILYSDFHDLYAAHSKTSIGYKEDEVAAPEDMLAYYSEEKVAKYGALAILISLVK